MEKHITQLVGIYEWVENGEYPVKIDDLECIIKAICYQNAKRYFDF